ncbi:MAG: M56 family metallopeptidase [Terriglobales bacterium]|jgi:beta-lactamase regulating signal transducer with metallopeptidase domain
MSWLPVQILAQVSIERILNALPEGFLIALFAWALLRVLRRQNSGTRFAVWFLAMLTVAALPVLGGFGEERALMVAGMSSFMSSAMPWGSARPAIIIPGRWALFVFLAWVFGAGAAMIRLAAGLWRLRQLRRSCTPIAAADLDPAVRKTVDAIGARAVTIATSECVRVPAAIGFCKRTIVLPAWTLRELPPDDLNVILLHEFAHLRRWDNWTNLIQKIVRALFFFHPAVWWIEKRLSVEREMACDDAVLAETSNPHGYASCLVSLLEKSLAHRLTDKRRSMAQAAVDRAREASLRLAQILDTNRPVATRVWKPALGMVGAFSMVCLAVLPHAPQFVAFDLGMLASNSDHGYSAAVSESSFQSSLRTAAVIPAAFRAGESSSVGKTPKVVHAHAVAGHPLAPARVVAARLNATPPRDRVVEASASADQEIVPQFRTLVFIEARQYVTSDSWVWSVQVWRVTVVSPVRERLAGVPVANSI